MARPQTLSMPCLEIDLRKLSENCRRLVRLAMPYGVEIAGVVKGCDGCPKIARTMLAAGMKGLCDSRTKNLRRLRQAGLPGPFWLIRSPAPGEMDQVLEVADVCLCSTPTTARLLSQAALRRGSCQDVVVMVDMGDGREGIEPEEAAALAALVRYLPGLRLRGLATNWACFRGQAPGAEEMRQFAALARAVATSGAAEAFIVSGGNSAVLPLMRAGDWCTEVNHLRIGETALLGRDTTDGSFVSDLHSDCFVLSAVVVEAGKRRSGVTYRSYAAAAPRVQAGGQALVAVGFADVGTGTLTPLDQNLVIEGMTSDLTVVRLKKGSGRLSEGDVLRFVPDYPALVGLMVSHHVNKVFSG